MNGSSTRSGASVDAERATEPAAAPPARRLGLVLAVAAGVVLLDQLTKWWAVQALATRTIHVVWTLQLNLVENRGTAFSLVRSGGQFIGPIAIVVVAVLIWQGRGVSSRLGAVALGMVLGGAIGNLLDRALRGDAGFMQGPVVDFIDFRWWPVFNVADIGVVVGGILLVLVYAFAPEPGQPGQSVQPVDQGGSDG